MAQGTKIEAKGEGSLAIFFGWETREVNYEYEEGLARIRAKAGSGS